MSERGTRWLAVAAVLASFYWMLGAAPLFDVDEGAFSQATLEMFERGDFLSTYLNGEPGAVRQHAPLLLAAARPQDVGARGIRLARAHRARRDRRAVVRGDSRQGGAWLRGRLLVEAQHRAFQRPRVGTWRQPPLLLS